MSSGTHYYNFKDQDELRDFLGNDLRRMKYFILRDGIVCEGQCERLTPNIIEEYGSSLLMTLLSEEAGVEVSPDYDSEVARLYFLYDYENLSREDAFEKCRQWYNVFYEEFVR